MAENVKARVRTARAQSKAREQLRELLRDTSLIQTVVIARNSADEWTVLVGGASAPDIAQALLIGAQALEIVGEHEKQADGGNGPIRLDFSLPVDEAPGPSTGRKRTPEIRRDAEGNLLSPPGEQWISCAECGCNRWYVTVCDDGTPGRDACVRCGNEIVTLRVQHEGGRA